MSEKVEQEMHFKRCDMNYTLDLLPRGRGRRSDVKNKRKKFRTSVARKNNNDDNVHAKWTKKDNG